MQRECVRNGQMPSDTKQLCVLMVGNGFNCLAADHGRKPFEHSGKVRVFSRAEPLLAFQGRHAFWLI